MRGKDLLDEQRIDAAHKQFDLGLELKSEYGPALAGKALVLTLQSQQVGLEPKKAAELLEESENLLGKALSKAEGPSEELSVQLLAMRTIAAGAEGDDWIDDVEDHFNDALEIFEDHPDLQASKAEPWYYWGQSNEKAFRFEEAQNAFIQVLELNRGFTREANHAIKKFSENSLKNIVGYTSDPIVSSDVSGREETMVFDEKATMVTKDALLKTLCWYDNGWGFSKRILDVIDKYSELEIKS